MTPSKITVLEFGIMMGQSEFLEKYNLAHCARPASVPVKCLFYSHLYIQINSTYIRQLSKAYLFGISSVRFRRERIENPLFIPAFTLAGPTLANTFRILFLSIYIFGIPIWKYSPPSLYLHDIIYECSLMLIKVKLPQKLNWIKKEVSI